MMETNVRYYVPERLEPVAQTAAPETSGPETSATVTRVRAPRPAAPVYAECGSGWYHEAAIKDAREMHGHPYSF